MSEKTPQNIIQSSNELSAILKYQRDFEHLIHDMFMDKDWTDTYPCSKQIRVLSYCVFYKFITAEHLLSMDWITGELHTEQVFLYRLVKKGHLQSNSSEIPGLKITIYSISPSGLRYCIDELSKILKENNPYQVTPECLEYIKQRAKGFTKTTSHAHSIGIRDLNAFLFSCLSDRAFQYMIEPTIDSQGQIYSFQERAAGNLVRIVNSIQSDAIITTQLHTKTLHIYVEQDMNTQRTNVIKQKIKNYLKCIYEPNRNAICEHSLLFTIMSKPTKTVYQSEEEEKKQYNRTTFSYVRVICFVIHMLSDESMTFYEVKMTDVLEQLEIYCEEAPVSVGYYQNVISFLKTFLAHDKDMTAEDFLEMARENDRTRNATLPQSLINRNRNAYLSRRKLIQNTVLESGAEIVPAFLSGLSIYTSHTRWHRSTFPYLLPPLISQNEERITLMLAFYELIPTSKTGFTYSPISSRNSQLVLKNQYIYENGLHVYIENYSDDIGGRTRIKHYLDSVSWSEPGSILICLIDKDDLSTVRRTFMKSTYGKALGQHVNVTVPLRVYFLQYEDFERGKNLFDFDAAGKIRSI